MAIINDKDVTILELGKGDVLMSEKPSGNSIFFANNPFGKQSSDKIYFADELGPLENAVVLQFESVESIERVMDLLSLLLLAKKHKGDTNE